MELPMPPQTQILPPLEFQIKQGSAVPQARRTSEPGKGKASTRAKSGCWTCRIRRKKCDEMKTAEGYCQTCVRLRLECLGWGSRRPDWMREKNNVIERREKIKEFLANNGMIKGHAGSISRTPTETQPDILSLAYTGNSPPRHPGDTKPLLNGIPGAVHDGINVLPPLVGDHDRRRNGGNALLDFAYVASDAQTYAGLHHYPHVAHHPHAAMHRHHLDAGPMLPPLTMPPLPSPGLDGGMRGAAHHLPPIPDTNGNVLQVDPALQYLSDFATAPTPGSSNDGTSSASASGSTATMDNNGRTVVSLQTPPTWTNPFAEPSSFGRLYNQPIDDYDEVNSPEVAAASAGGASSTAIVLAGSNSSAATGLPPGTVYVDHQTGMTMPGFTVAPLRWVGEMPDAGFVFHYLKEVLPVQYLLADQTSIRQWTYHLAQTSESTRSALCLLAALHKHCMSQMSIQGPPGSTTELDVFYSNTRNALRTAKTITEGDALASLHVISSFLFAGGRGPWHEYLDIASRWVESVLQDPRHATPREALRHASESVRFIIRATFWFDCLAAISQLRSPSFLHIYRELFGSTPASIIASGEADDPDVSMMDVMGCSATGFLSLAEIAALAHWKEEQRKQGKLSVPRLVERGTDIESRFLRATAYEPGETGFLGSQNADPDILLTSDGVEFRRRLVSNVFRASAKVYLHSVISGGFPETPEIAAGVAETISYLKKVPGYSDASRVVVRSVVFSVCIAGCMTDEPSQQDFFLQQLQALGQEAEVLGNCSQAKKLMQRVWANRKEMGGGEVDWRQAMFEAGPGILLLA